MLLNKILKQIGLILIIGTLTQCVCIKKVPTDVAYHYANGFVTDNNNKIVAHYANGLVTRYSDITNQKHIQINRDLELVKLTPNSFLYTAWADMGRWGRIGSNGLVVVSKGKALLVDSPTLESQTVELAWWFDKNLDIKFDTFIPGHWHDDCVGGLAWLNRNGVKTYANRLTNEILASKGLEYSNASFSDSLFFKMGNIEIEAYYLGGGHSTDNIVVWIPSEKILFGGCMLKDVTTQDIGNISDAAPFEEWLQTIKQVEERFPDVKYVIPGHGKYGGKELFKHTRMIIENESHRKRSL